jgi:molybdopterin/thiamine biosynthesis adenylyltransferase
MDYVSLDAEQFYAALTARNRGLVSEKDQQRLRRSPILVAGCGSIGGAVVEPLVRLGAERLTLAEPDGYELHNLNRQYAALADVGRNKADVLADWARTVNPHATAQVVPEGVTAGNVADLVGGAALIIDGVDVTTKPALAAKYALHAHARRGGVPVVCGYDIAGVQLVRVYDYRRPSTEVLDGRVAGHDPADLDPLRFLARVVPLRALPAEIFPVLRAQLSGEDVVFPQLVYTARMFGVLASRLTLDLLAHRPVRACTIVDIHALSRPALTRWRFALNRLGNLARMGRTAVAYRRTRPAVRRAPSMTTREV